MRPDRVLYALAGTLVVAAVMVAAAFVGDRPGQSTAHQITFPHGTRCDRTDAYTGPPCRAAYGLMKGAHDSNPALFCRYRYQQDAYQECVAGIYAADSGGFDSMYASDYHVLYARLALDGVARVRVRVLTVDGTTGDVMIVLERSGGVYRYVTYYCVCPTPPPAG